MIVSALVRAPAPPLGPETSIDGSPRSFSVVICVALKEAEKGPAAPTRGG